MTLERLGESGGFEWAVLELLHRAGWKVWVQGRFGGDGVLVIATQGSGPQVAKEGESVAAVLPELVHECVQFQMAEKRAA